MKHNLKIITALIILFLAAQVIGLIVTSRYVGVEKLPLGIERPEVKDETTSFLPVFILVMVATALGLILIRYSLFSLWKFWFLLTIFITLTISFGAFINEKIAIAMAAVFALLKVFKGNWIIHNFTELFIYGALATMFVPIFNIVSVFVLLILISVYDYIAVRKTEHMIRLAKFQGENKTFAGLMVPYKKGTAILGGGDIGFPLLFAAVAMKELHFGLLDYRAYLIPVAVSLVLFGLFLYGKDKKYYPAMPYATAGCIIGYLAALIF